MQVTAQPLGRVDVHFADAIPIVVTRPFLLSVADGRVPANDVVVALHGVHDPHTGLEEIQALADRIPGAVLHLFPEAGHSPHSERESRDECNRLVKEFLES